MHRTQIYLQDDIYETLKAKSRADGVSIAELIRRSVQKDLCNDPVANAEAFFKGHPPLESFKTVDPKSYVRTLRGASRLLRTQR